MNCLKPFDSASSGTPTSGVLIACLLLAGCATTGRVEVDLPALGDWEQRRSLLADADDWSLTGRIGIRSDDDGFNARFRHTQDGRRFDATLSGPLGVGTIRVAGDTRAIVLTDKDGEQLTLSNPEADLLRLYGWTIPLDSLKYWALGIPDPAVAATPVIDDAGRLTSLEQRGWRVDIDRYREYAGQQLPARITATSTTTRVRLVVDRWRFYDQP
ncbi:MAG: lipoprotein insertase outer membrane protein LolB [Pseudomonadota bacterium]